jgi:hypothetical protein
LNLVRMRVFTSLFFRFALAFLDAAPLLHERASDPFSSSVQGRGSPTRRAGQHAVPFAHALSRLSRNARKF